MQSISPEIIYRGNDAWKKALPRITNLTKSPLILGRSVHTNDIKNKIFRDLKNKDLSVNSANLQYDCCYEDILKVNPNYINAYNNYANLKTLVNDYDGAIQLYKKAYSIIEKMDNVPNSNQLINVK